MKYIARRIITPDWTQIEAVQLVHQPWLAPCNIQASAQLCHDGEKLYVHMQAKEHSIRATLTQPLDQVCNDSCLEFFFAPLANDTRYFNFEWNPLGTLFLGFGDGRKTCVRQIVNNVDAFFAPQTFTTSDGWGIEFTIPVSFIQMYMPEFSLASESAGNFYKCGDKTDIVHYLAWSDLSSDYPNFHRPQDFGTIIFEDAI